MSFRKLVSPDFFLGKILITLRCWFDMLGYLVKNRSQESLHLASVILRIKPKYTMVTSSNLVNLYRLVKKLDGDSIPGDIVECGVWNGGSSALMGYAHAQKNGALARTFWLFDSFSGLPKPGEKDGKQAQDTFYQGYCLGSEAKVREVVRKLRLPLDEYAFVPGWFEDTLPKTQIDRIALLHIDADWYDSVKQVLDTYYDSVVPNGFIALDDYGYWEGCKRAVDEFFQQRGITPHINPVSKTGIYIQKPGARDG